MKKTTSKKQNILEEKPGEWSQKKWDSYQTMRREDDANRYGVRPKKLMKLETELVVLWKSKLPIAQRDSKWYPGIEIHILKTTFGLSDEEIDAL